MAERLKQSLPPSAAARHATQAQLGKAAQLEAEARNQDDAGRSSSGRKSGVLSRIFSVLTERVDHSHEGFIRACRDAVTMSHDTEWVSADQMCEQIEHDIAVLLRAKKPEQASVHSGVYVEFVGVHRKERTPRLVIVTDWGFREVIQGTVSFGLFTQPPRRQG